MGQFDRFSIRPGGDFSGADLSEFDFYRHYGISGLRGGPGANFQDCKFIGTNFKASGHYHTDFQGSDLTGADMSQSQCRETLFGSRARESSPAILLKTNFNSAYLGGSHFFGVLANGATFINANLEYCAVDGAIFESADFGGAILSHLNQLPRYGSTPVNFSQANLSYANLSYSDLSGANFSGANLTGANFYGAITTGIIFDDKTILDGAQNLSGHS